MKTSLNQLNPEVREKLASIGFLLEEEKHYDETHTWIITYRLGSLLLHFERDISGSIAMWLVSELEPAEGFPFEGLIGTMTNATEITPLTLEDKTRFLCEHIQEITAMFDDTTHLLSKKQINDYLKQYAHRRYGP